MRNALLFGAWVLACAVGLFLLGAKSAESAPNASAPATWPMSARVNRAPGRPTLLVFAHPRCPCTRATMRELERLVARAKDRPDVWIVLAKGGSGLVSLGSVEGAHVLEDDGAEAARFGVKTSGQVLVYGRDGRLVFSGGITPARGHEGDSRGADLALRALSPAGSSPASSSSADVFGCGIANKEP